MFRSFSKYFRPNPSIIIRQRIPNTTKFYLKPSSPTKPLQKPHRTKDPFPSNFVTFQAHLTANPILSLQLKHCKVCRPVKLSPLPILLHSSTSFIVRAREKERLKCLRCYSSKIIEQCPAAGQSHFCALIVRKVNAAVLSRLINYLLKQITSFSKRTICPRGDKVEADHGKSSLKFAQKISRELFRHLLRR